MFDSDVKTEPFTKSMVDYWVAMGKNPQLRSQPVPAPRDIKKALEAQRQNNAVNQEKPDSLAQSEPEKENIPNNSQQENQGKKEDNNFNEKLSDIIGSMIGKINVTGRQPMTYKQIGQVFHFLSIEDTIKAAELMLEYKVSDQAIKEVYKRIIVSTSLIGEKELTKLLEISKIVNDLLEE